VNKLIMIAVIAVLVLESGCSLLKKTDMQITHIQVTHLRCEYLVNPLGIDITQPRLSWVLESSTRGQKQTAYRVIVASNEKDLNDNNGDLWDSGKMTSDQSAQIIYGGRELHSHLQCFWKVCVWDGDGSKSEFSTPAYWTMGLLNDEDWKGSWIGMKMDPASYGMEKPEPGPPPPWFRKDFTLDKPVKKAFVYVTARGLFELHINGERVGKDVFAPEWTDYDKRIQYRTYDVTSMLKENKNAVGAVVGEGWYSGYIGWLKHRGHYGLQNSLLLQLEVEYNDGTRDVLVTDETWRCTDGPILNSDFMMGENYDARREMPGWDTVGFDESSWQSADIIESPAARLVAQPSEPVQVTEYITPVSIKEPQKSVYVFDLGQNITGWARLRVRGEAGTQITLRFAERLNPDGTIYTENLRAAKTTDTYILKGGKEEVYEPRFTFHGFQYVEMTGFQGTPEKGMITGCVVHSTTPPAGTFECSNSMVNKLFKNITWGQRGNFLSVPTDCPQRDERLGWMGDAQVFIRTGSFNMDVAAFFTKWMIDVEDAQSKEGSFADVSPRIKDNPKMESSPAWADAGIIIPWTIYRVYGDTRIIEKHYKAMTAWMDYLLEANPDFIRINKVNNNYGDWLSINAKTPKDLLATAYWAYDARLMSRMAEVIGLYDVVLKYDRLFEDIRAVFQKEFISPDGSIKGETQTGYLLALSIDLIPEELRVKAAEHLVKNISNCGWHLSTGFIGCGYLNPVLTSMGYSDVAYRLLLNDTFPSWGYSIKHGATTIWERWDGWTEEKGFQNPGMNSFNHYSFGSVGEWMYRSVAGIDLHPDVPGYKHIVIRPQPESGLEYTRAEYNSIHGKILSGWKRSDGSLELDVTIPANTTATVYVPADEGTEITESGKPAEKAEGVTFINRENNTAVYTIGSGAYRFKSSFSK